MSAERVPFRQQLKRWVLGTERRPTRIMQGLAAGVWMELDRSSHLRLICGLYEPAIRDFLATHLRRAEVCFDVGGNAGYYSLLFASQPSVKEVHAFEPHPRLIDEFDANMKLNPGLAPKIRLHRMALGQGGSNVRLDEWMQSEALPAPDLVKIDVDGPELDILRGSRNLLERKKTAWVVETHSLPLEEEVEKLFHDHGYKTRFPAGPWWLGWFPEERTHVPNRHLVAIAT